MTSKIDYSAVDIPDKDPKEYTYVERRAELLQFIIEEANPATVSRTEMGERYGVSHSQISQDIDRLGDSVAEHLGSKVEFRLFSIFEKVLMELKDDEEWKDVWDVAQDWSDWLSETGRRETVPDRQQVEMTSGGDSDEFVVQFGDSDEDIPRNEDGSIDYDEAGFTRGPNSG